LTGVNIRAVYLVLEGVLAVSRNHLLVDGLGELRYMVLLLLHGVLQVVVLLAQVADVLIVDERQRVLQVAEAMVHVIGVSHSCLDRVHVSGVGLVTALAMIFHVIVVEVGSGLSIELVELMVSEGPPCWRNDLPILFDHINSNGCQTKSKS
jgi:hypothetical protein